MRITEKPDGSREIEGTPAELAEYERSRWQSFTVPGVTIIPSPVYPVPSWPPALPTQPYTITCQGPTESGSTAGLKAR